MKLSIVTLEDTIFSSDNVKHVQLPTTAGEIGIYDRHVPLLARLGRGSVAIDTTDGTKHLFTVADGVVEVKRDKVVLLASLAEPTKEEAKERLREAVKEAKEEAQKSGIDIVARKRAEKLYAIEEARLKALERRGK